MRIAELQMWDVRLWILPCALSLAPFALGLLTPETSRFSVQGGSWLVTILAAPDFLSGSVLARVVLACIINESKIRE